MSLSINAAHVHHGESNAYAQWAASLLHAGQHALAATQRRGRVGLVFQFPERHFLGADLRQVGCLPRSLMPAGIA